MRTMVTNMYLNCNERGEVERCNKEEAQGCLSVYVFKDQIISVDWDGFDEEVEDDEVLDSDSDRQIDLFDRFSNPKFEDFNMED